jgi:hypothetical protein
MPISVEIFAAGGIAVGVVPRSGHLRELLESGSPVVLEGATWHPLDESPARPSGELRLAADDIHLATTDEIDDIPVHAQWHDVALTVGPYRVRGEMPTMPGFDPGRALARPTGEFVQLRDVSIGLLVDRDEPGLTRPAAFVNRYVVDFVDADLMLGFFFPGATMPAKESVGPRPPASPAAPGPADSSPLPAT